MLNELEKIAAHFTKLDADDIKCLTLLRLINEFTEEEDAKQLKHQLNSDPVIQRRRWDAWTAAQDEARAANPDPDFSDPDAWFHIGDDEFTALGVVEDMSEQERKELLRRMGR